MKIIDNIYGEEEINEQVLIDLINSQEIQRLKEISQFGLPERYYHIPVFSRYEHSIGVLILLRRLGANLDEQIAGLLHDISHTAFSHVIDWVIGDPTKEDHQDNIYKEILINSKIPRILENHGMNHNNFLVLEDFSLLEREAPSLCADRIDYSLRELVNINGERVNFLINDLKNYNRQIVFVSKETARIFARKYINLQNNHWAGTQARARYYLLREILKEALDNEIIFVTDFKKTDEEIISRLIDSGNSSIINQLNLLKKQIFFKEDEKGIPLRKKFRYVDPEILIGEKIRRLSELSEEYFNILEREKQNLKIEKRIVILK